MKKRLVFISVGDIYSELIGVRIRTLLSDSGIVNILFSRSSFNHRLLLSAESAKELSPILLLLRQ